MNKEEIAEDVARTRRYLNYEHEMMTEWHSLGNVPSKQAIFDPIVDALKIKHKIVEGDSSLAKMTEDEMLGLADLKPIDTSVLVAGEISPDRCFYTLLNGEGTSCYYKVGIFRFDRLETYTGKYLGYLPGTTFS